MTDTRPDSRGPSSLRRAIAADTIGCFTDTHTVSGEDLAALKAIVAGKEKPAFAVDNKRALGVLARSDQTRESADLLARTLADRSAPLRERAAAAAYLGQLPPEAAESRLLEALPVVTGPLRTQVIQSLAQAGTQKALAELRKIDSKEDSDAAQIALARLAIAYRSGGNEPLLERLGARWSEIVAQPASAEELRQTVESINGSKFSVPLNVEDGLRFACGRVEHFVLLNAALRRGQFAKALRAGNAIAAVIVMRADRLRAFNVRWLVLTSPGDKGLAMALVRPSGEAALVGQALPAEGELRFEMRSTGLERTPVEVRGTITDERIGWTMRAWQGGIRGKQRPRLVGRPAVN